MSSAISREAQAAQSLFDKIWASHIIKIQSSKVDGATPDTVAVDPTGMSHDEQKRRAADSLNNLLYIDRIFLHERTGAIALKSLQHDKRVVHDRRRVFCTIDHIVDTHPGRTDKTLMPSGELFIAAAREATTQSRIKLFDIDDEYQGIVHVISPELGIVLPGLTIVCPDSHTCTQGAFGALAIGIGSSETEHALVTQTLRMDKPLNMRVNLTGSLGDGVTAHDLMLALIQRFGASGGNGYVIEFYGPVVDDMSLDARMTLCNLAVEFSARSGIIAPDIKVFEYLKGRRYAPSAEHWQQACAYWSQLKSDTECIFDKEITIDVTDVEPMVTWGTSPEHAVGIEGHVPKLENFDSDSKKNSAQQAMEYQGVKPGQRVQGITIDAAFIGSCTTSRLSDLRAAASLLKNQKIADHVKGVVVPGSTQVKNAAEREGLHQLFINAGFEWREAGCSMCFYAGGETFGRQKRVISTTNRNFEGRQGPGTRTHLANPLTVVASAIAGKIVSPMRLLEAAWKNSEFTVV